MTKEYVHMKMKDIGIQKTFYENQIEGGAIQRRIVLNEFVEEFVLYQGKSVLVVRKRERIDGFQRCLTYVPGVIVNYKSKLIGDKKDLPVSIVELITDTQRRNEFSDLLTNIGIRGEIYFWSD